MMRAARVLSVEADTAYSLTQSTLMARVPPRASWQWLRAWLCAASVRHTARAATPYFNPAHTHYVAFGKVAS
jgi:hypothetical protein